MNIYLAVILCILLVEYFLTVAVDALNVRSASPVLPEEFSGVYDAERYAKSQRYLRDNTNFGLLQYTVMAFGLAAFILVGGFNLIDVFARSFGLSDIPTGLIFGGALLLITWALGLPFSAYRTFVLEEKYGFNRTTPRTFAADAIKGFLLSAVVGGVLLGFVMWFFAKAGPRAWVYCWAAVLVFEFFLVFVSPVVIMPLFNKFTPVEEGRLKSTFETYAKKENFRMKGLFKMDGSRRSTKSNAFFTGFGSFRRIVLFDTLIARHTVDELTSVLAHEMGHYKKRHIIKSMLVSALTTGLMFFVLSLLIGNKELAAAFGMKRVSIYSSLLFFGFLFRPINYFFSVLGNVLSRRHEYEADAYAAKTYGRPDAMISALKKLSADNLSNLTPHPLKVFLQYSHPPVLDRIKALRKLTTNGVAA
jgi:STE24 endopeptidase